MRLKFANKNEKIEARTDVHNIKIIYDTKKHKYGLKYANQEMILPVIYDLISDTLEYGCDFNDFCFRLIKGKQAGFIKDGKVFLFNVDDLDPFTNQRAIIQSQGLFGVINDEGKVLIQPRYESITGLNSWSDKEGQSIKGLPKNSAYMAEKDKKVAIFDNNGKEILPPIYEDFNWADNRNFIIAKKGPGWLVLKDLKPLNNKIYRSFFRSSWWTPEESPFFQVTGFNDKKGLLDDNGEELISPKYDEIGSFKDHVAEICLNKEYGLINLKAKEIIQPIYSKKEMTQLTALVNTGEYSGTKEEQYLEAHEEFQDWKKEQQNSGDINF